MLVEEGSSTPSSGSTSSSSSESACSSSSRASSKKSCRFPRRKSLGACQTKRKQACLLSMDLRRPLRTSSDEVHDRRMNKNAGLYQLLLWCRSSDSRSITAAITQKRALIICVYMNCLSISRIFLEAFRFFVKSIFANRDYYFG